MNIEFNEDTNKVIVSLTRQESEDSSIVGNNHGLAQQVYEDVLTLYATNVLYGDSYNCSNIKELHSCAKSAASTKIDFDSLLGMIMQETKSNEADNLNVQVVVDSSYVSDDEPKGESSDSTMNNNYASSFDDDDDSPLDDDPPLLVTGNNDTTPHDDADNDKPIASETPPHDDDEYQFTDDNVPGDDLGSNYGWNLLDDDDSSVSDNYSQPVDETPSHNEPSNENNVNQLTAIRQRIAEIEATANASIQECKTIRAEMFEYEKTVAAIKTKYPTMMIPMSVASQLQDTVHSITIGFDKFHNASNRFMACAKEIKDIISTLQAMQTNEYTSGSELYDAKQLLQKASQTLALFDQEYATLEQNIAVYEQDIVTAKQVSGTGASDTEAPKTTSASKAEAPKAKPSKIKTPKVEASVDEQKRQEAKEYTALAVIHAHCVGSARPFKNKGKGDLSFISGYNLEHAVMKYMYGYGADKELKNLSPEEQTAINDMIEIAKTYFIAKVGRGLKVSPEVLAIVPTVVQNYGYDDGTCPSIVVFKGVPRKNQPNEDYLDKYFVVIDDKIVESDKHGKPLTTADGSMIPAHDYHDNAVEFAPVPFESFITLKGFTLRTKVINFKKG